MILVFILCTLSIYRARRQGIPWSDITSFPSQWFNWAVLGNKFEETVSARSYINSEHNRLWRILSKILDTIFYFKEKDHCSNSFKRVKR